MSYQDTIRGTWNENQLFSVLVELTYRCNLDCFFCYNDLALRGRALSLEDYHRMLGELKELGCLHLTLSGGEPLAHPHFFAIGSRARKEDFVVRIKTNGHGVTKSTSQRIKDEVDPYMVEISLHGARPETHDRQTRVTGSFHRLMENLDGIREVGLRFKLNSTLTCWNESEIVEMYSLADSFGVPLQFDPDVTVRDDGDTEPRSIAPTADGLRELYRVQAARFSGNANAGSESVQKQGDAEISFTGSDKHCGAGSSGLAIDPFGNIYPCVQWRRPIGNLHQDRLTDLWGASAALGEIRDLTVKAKKRVEAAGSVGKFLNFCPGSAEMATGSPLGVSDEMMSRAEIAMSTLPLHPSQS